MSPADSIEKKRLVDLSLSIGTNIGAKLILHATSYTAHSHVSNDATQKHWQPGRHIFYASLSVLN